MGESQHGYLIRTDANYREKAVASTVLRLASLVEALAIRSGLSIDPDSGEVLGLTDKEAALMSSPGDELGTGPSVLGESGFDQSSVQAPKAEAQDAYVAAPTFGESTDPQDIVEDISEAPAAEKPRRKRRSKAEIEAEKAEG